MNETIHVRIESPAFASDAVEVASLDGTEAISRLFRFDVRVVCKDPGGLDEDAVLTSPAVLVFERGDQELRRIFGAICQIEDMIHTETQHSAYALTFVPRAWALTLVETYEVFLDRTIPEIVTTKLERLGMKQGDDFEWRLLGAYRKREFVTQYAETDLAFCSRHLENLGISFFFEHTDDRDVLVLCDDNSGFHPIAAGQTVPFYTRGEKKGVYQMKSVTRTVPGRYTVTDYNYRKPQVALLATAAVGGGGAGGIVEYGAHVKDPDETAHIARVRAEEKQSTRRRFSGESDLPSFAAGAKCALDGHPRGDVKLLLTEVRHRAAQAALGMGQGSERSYWNEFQATLAETPFRPARVTPRPSISGVVTGIIEAEAKSEYAEMDDVGRYHVRFKFDTNPANAAKASHLVRMAQPHVGAGFGMHFPLRAGVEVILAFVDGDPDRPVIAGAVSNPHTPNVVDRSNGRRNIIRTGGNNEINIDDTNGAERIKLSTPFGGSSFQLGAPNTPESGAALATAGAFTQIANQAATTLTSTSTLMADVASMLAAANITNIAGVTNVMSAVDKGFKIIDDILDLGKNVCDTGSKIYDAKQKTLEHEATAHQEEADKLKKSAEQAPPNHPIHHAAAQSQQAATAAKQRAAEHKKWMDEESDAGPSVLKKIGIAIDLAKDVSKGEQATRKTFSSAAKLLNRASSSSAAVAANAMGTAAGAAAALGRVGTAVPAVASPWNINASVVSSAVTGTVNALLGGGVSGAVVGGAQVVCASDGAAHLKGGALAEVAGGGKVFITSPGFVDILAGGKFVTKAGTEGVIEAGTRLAVQAGGVIEMSAGGSLQAKAKADITVQATGIMNLKADGATEITAGPSITAKATNITLDAKDAEVKGSGTANLLAGSWGVRANDGMAKLGSGGDACVVIGGSAMLKSGGDSVECAGGVTVKGSTVAIKGSGGVSVNGARIDLG